MLDLPHDTPELAIRPAVAAALYAAVAIVFTWPLVIGLTRDIPWDLGDSLLNAWILAWDANRLSEILSGHFDAVRGFWNANIFYPEPLTLAYSEHMFAQAVQILPVYVLTGNIILCYNLLFLSTFVLSGLGMFLFVREVTRSPRAAFAAGLIYAFAPYRVPQFSHLQVISSQWMPFVLYGLRRFFDAISAPGGESNRGKVYAPLAGAGTALVAQNLSNGYFLLFFAPFVLAYALFEIGTRRLWTSVRVWTALTATAAAVMVLTLPFLLPYLELRKTGPGLRSLNEVRSFSADFFSYWTAPAESHVWGTAMRAFPQAERDLFLTFSAMLLAGIACASTWRDAWRQSRSAPPASALMIVPSSLLLAGAAIYLVFMLLVITGYGFSHIGPLAVSVRNLWRVFRIFAVIAAGLLIVSPRARAVARQWAGTLTAFAILAALAAVFLSFGPEIRTEGRLISEVGPYSFFYRHVPGFDGLRVPARFAMLVVLFLSVAAGCGAAMLERRHRLGGAMALGLGALAVLEAFPAPITLNGTAEELRYATPPPRVHTGDDAPAVYRFLKTLPRPGTVAAEFPFGEWAFDVRYVFYSTVHWHPLLNGYSGHFPLSYSINATHFRHPLDQPESSWAALVESGATHAIVHGTYYRDDEGERIARWLVDHGAKPVGEFDGDRVFALR